MASPIKLFVATLLYEGKCFSKYMTGMLELFSFCTTYKIPVTFYGVNNLSLTTKARNECIYHFLQSDCTHFFLIDADIGFTGKEAAALLLLSLNDTEKKYDILAAAYPEKEISWDRIKLAIKEGMPEFDLSKYGSPCTATFPENITKTPIETSVINAGFMLIPRRTLQDFIKAYPEKAFIVRSKELWHSFFECIIDPETKEFLAENITFCQSMRKIGKKLWIAPWLELSRQGSHTFEGSLQPLLQEEK
jgi:hypothetical protein